jgi:hypothetical protein
MMLLTGTPRIMPAMSCSIMRLWLRVALRRCRARMVVTLTTGRGVQGLMASDRYPLLTKALEEGRVKPTDPPKRVPRCGPWHEREDGALVCEKCGDVDFGPNERSPFGF